MENIRNRAMVLSSKLFVVSLLSGLATWYVVVNPSIPSMGAIVPFGIAIYGVSYVLLSEIGSYVKETNGGGESTT